MIKIRQSKDRGYFDHGWLQTYHTFSFGDYYDPLFMGYRSLRVINQDYVQAGHGFPTHSHRDMEIITYILEGALSHKDSMGTGSTIVPGDVQFMSAGSGVTHSEYNHSKDQIVHLLQIWIMPAIKGGAPRYDQRHFPDEERRGVFRLVASGDGRDGSLQIGQDANLFATILEKGRELTFDTKPDRFIWIQVAKGQLEVNGNKIYVGDGLEASSESSLVVKALDDSEFLTFDLN
jgi:redox-sensitive bicupin YhaK (pirin superfamily)